MSQRASTFHCPQCHTYPQQYGQSVKTTTGRRFTRICRNCNRKMVTHQVTGEPELFVRWIAQATPKQKQRYERLRLSLELAEMPPMFFRALANVGRRLGV